MIRPAEFSEYGWERFLPFIERQPEGGMVLIVAEVLPTQNWPRISVGTFAADARKRLKRALKAEAKQKAAVAGDVGSFRQSKAAGVGSAPSR